MIVSPPLITDLGSTDALAEKIVDDILVGN